MMTIELKLFTLSYTHLQTNKHVQTLAHLSPHLHLHLLITNTWSAWVRTPRESSVEICLRDFAASSDRVPIYGLFSAESSSHCGRLCADVAGFGCVRELERGVFFFAVAMLLVAMMDRRYGYSQLMPVPRYGVGCRS